MKLLFSRVRPCASQSSETPYIDRLSATDRHAFSCRKAQTVRTRSFQKSIVSSNAFASIAQLSHLCPLYLRRNFYVNIRYLSALSSFYQNRPAFALSASNIIYSFVIFDLLSHFAKTDETIWIAVSGNNSVRQQLRTHKLFAYLYGSTTYVLCRFLIFQHRLIFLFSLNFYFYRSRLFFTTVYI